MLYYIISVSHVAPRTRCLWVPWNDIDLRKYCKFFFSLMCFSLGCLSFYYTYIDTHTHTVPCIIAAATYISLCWCTDLPPPENQHICQTVDVVMVTKAVFFYLFASLSPVSPILKVSKVVYVLFIMFFDVIILKICVWKRNFNIIIREFIAGCQLEKNVQGQWIRIHLTFSLVLCKISINIVDGENW